MAKDTEKGKGPVNRHKMMAMGEKIPVMKMGGMMKKPEKKSDKKKGK